MSTALRSVGLLDILSSMPAGPCVALAGKLPDAPCIHARLRRLAAKPGEKCGLVLDFESDLENYLVFCDFVILDIAPLVDHLEPIHVPDCT